MWAGGKGADDVVTVFLRSNVDIQQVDKNGGTGKLTTFIYIFFYAPATRHLGALSFTRFVHLFILLHWFLLNNLSSPLSKSFEIYRP